MHEAKPNAIQGITGAINPKYHSKLCYHMLIVNYCNSDLIGQLCSTLILFT